MQGLTVRGDEGALEKKLNAELGKAKLFRGDCSDRMLLGFLSPVKLRPTSGFLALQTGVGIECGFDESAYLYRWQEGGWTRAWQNEQNTAASPA